MTRADWQRLVEPAQLKFRDTQEAFLCGYFFGVLHPDGTCSLFDILHLTFEDLVRLAATSFKPLVGFHPGLMNSLGVARICGVEKRPQPTFLSFEEVLAHVDVIIDATQPDKIVGIEWGVRKNLLSVPRERVTEFLRRRKAPPAN